MAGADLYSHSSSKWVNVKFVDSLTSLERNCADTKFHVHVYIGVMVQLREFKEKKKNMNNYIL